MQIVRLWRAWIVTSSQKYRCIIRISEPQKNENSPGTKKLALIRRKTSDNINPYHQINMFYEANGSKQCSFSLPRWIFIFWGTEIRIMQRYFWLEVIIHARHNLTICMSKAFRDSQSLAYSPKNRFRLFPRLLISYPRRRHWVYLSPNLITVKRSENSKNELWPRMSKLFSFEWFG